MCETIISKKCTICKQIKPLVDYSKNRTTKNGYQRQCKKCRKIMCKAFRQSDKGKKYYLEYNHKYYKSAKYRGYQQSEKRIEGRKRYECSIKGKRKSKKYRANNLAKCKARSAVNQAVKMKRLPAANTLKCNYCKGIAKEYHHWRGYALEHWLDVVPVCIPCHNN